MSSRASLVVISFLVGCYGKPPPPRKPIRDVPTLVEGQPMVIHTDEKETVSVRKASRSDCVSDGRNGMNCGPEKYRTSKGSYTERTVTYGDQQLTRGQVVALATPDLDARAVEYDRSRSRCKKFGAPRIVAGVLVLGGILFYPFGGSLVESSSTRIAIGAGAVGAGFLTWAIGYLAGGGVCNESARLYNRYFAGPNETTMSSEVLEVVKEFNAKLGAAPAPAAE